MTWLLAEVLPATVTWQPYPGKVWGPSGPSSPPLLCWCQRPPCHHQSHQHDLPMTAWLPKPCLACQCSLCTHMSHWDPTVWPPTKHQYKDLSVSLKAKKTGDFCGKWQSHISQRTGVQEYGALNADCHGGLGNGYNGTRSWLSKWFCWGVQRGYGKDSHM